MATPANLAVSGGDPRDPSAPLDPRKSSEPVDRALDHTLHDPNISFEEYVHYASITRAEEKEANDRYVAAQGPKTWKTVLKNRFLKGDEHELPPSEPERISSGEKTAIDEKSSGENQHNRMAVTDAEWKQASRAVRTAGWSGIFFLITTDILGPFSVPWAFAQMGYGPGIALYTVFGAFALYSGFQIYNVFIHLDSDRYPMRNFGDTFFRVYGKWARHFVNIAQAIQLLFTVSILILSNGQSISQVAKGKLCFIVCLLVFMLAGWIVGQIRTLQRFSWLANFAVWINVLIIFICMGVAANSAPNFAATEASFGFGPGPVHRYAGTPPDGMASGGSGFTGSLNGLNQAVYSYGGAMLFVAFLAEMRHPMDFWKGLICADLFIYFCYMFFGLFVYSYQGQFAFNPVMQGLSPYNWQTAANIMNMITGLIAAALYGNIGIKVAYVEVFQELLGAPPLTTKTGKMLWIALVPVYWVAAWAVCAAIPQFSYISGLVGALFILQFTYTFPAILAVGFQVQLDAMLPGQEHFDESTGVYTRIDSGLTRLKRGFMVKPLFNSFNTFYFLGALTTAALGIYSSCLGLKDAFNGQSVATSFGCTPPV